MLEELVHERGGVAVRSLAEAATAGPEPRFVALPVLDDGLLPAVAKLGAAERNAYLLKAGLVGGPAGEPGARTVEPELIATVLDAALANRVEWEEDPDFGYLVAAAVPGVAYPEDGLLMPRLLYARNGRVYEHAALVPQAKRRWAALLPRQ